MGRSIGDTDISKSHPVRRSLGQHSILQTFEARNATDNNACIHPNLPDELIFFIKSASECKFKTFPGVVIPGPSIATGRAHGLVKGDPSFTNRCTGAPVLKLKRWTPA